MQRALAWLATLTGFVIAAALCVMAWQGMRSHAVPQLTTPYQAVALTNGQVFFGRIDSLDGNYTVLRDVFYIQSRQNPDSKEVANVLIKRGAEAHTPDRMVINRQQVLLIEPVGTDSRIAKLIAEQQVQAR
jgi:small nuclear ribonucleoprotein (snRNP)-like protein